MTETAPVGWYPDPGDYRLVRRRDGAAWTDDVQPADHDTQMRRMTEIQMQTQLAVQQHHADSSARFWYWGLAVLLVAGLLLAWRLQGSL